MDFDVSSESEGDFQETPHHRGRSPRPCLISGSWVIQMALSRIQTTNAWEVALPEAERKRLTWTGTTGFMALDGIVEAFLDTDFLPLKCYRGRSTQAQVIHGSANVTDVDAAPEGKRMATVAFFTEKFFQTQLTDLVRCGPRLLNMILASAENTIAEALASSLQDDSDDHPSHAVARRITCPLNEGAETAQWLFDTFTALRAPRYSPNGEAPHIVECDISRMHR